MFYELFQQEGERMDERAKLGSSDDPVRLERMYLSAQEALASRRFDDIDSVLSGFNDLIFRASTWSDHGTNPSAPKVSVVIVSYQSSPGVPAALTCIARQARDTGSEIILVDNGNDDLLDQANETLEGFKYVKPPFQVGCSAGRNLGARLARSHCVVFLDDDGVIEPGCIGALAKCLAETSAIAVRGRVVPLTAGTAKPPHYDLGDIRVPAIITCEGVSAWRRSEFLEFGGFHPVLAGQEGLELCAKMWPFFGPVAFLYEPSAVLRHDFADDAAQSDEKRRVHETNKEFVLHKYPEAMNIYSRTLGITHSPREFYLAYKAMVPVPPVDAQPISVITTARNASGFLKDYAASWQRQLLPDSQIVFVDDCSTDDTYAQIQDLFRGDDRLTLIRSPAAGRGAALNAAVESARNDICLIADVDDISIPGRVAHTLNTYKNNPHLDYFSFLLFQEGNPFRSQRRQAPLLVDLGIEALFGMPLPFPAFTFRKSKFAEKFDETLRGGVDFDWLSRNLAIHALKGTLVQIPMVYYRRHPGQITSQHNDVQKTVRKDLIFQEFERILGAPLSERDRRLIDIFVDIKKTTPAQKKDLIAWVMNVLRANERTKADNQHLLSTALLDALDDVAAISDKPKPSAHSRNIPTANRVHELRIQAEDHIRKREFKQARRILREALALKPKASIRMRILSASKFGVVRGVFRTKPYRGSEEADQR
jgi:glycosyltransferase involved in cell wall biosynthesis